MRIKFISVPTIIATVMIAMLFTNVMAGSTGFGIGYTSADVGGNSQSVANKGVIATGRSATFASEDFDGNFGIGLGIGIPYGMFGVNAEYYLIDNLSISAGLGTTLLAGVGYDVGVQYYFGNKRNGWIPRISAHYGTNGVLQTKTVSYEEGESFDGFSAGIGLKNVRGNSSWVIDLFYVVTSGIFDRIDELEAQGYEEVSTYGPENIGVGVGYSYRF
jgi:hypothetical protein